MTELRVGAHPRDVIPGAPEDVETLATRLETYSDDARDAAARLGAIDSGAWVGSAGDAFRDAIGELPEKLRRASDAFWDAGAALRVYAGRLRDAQAAAAKAIELFSVADSRSRTWAAQQKAHDDAVRSSAGSEAPPPALLPVTDDPGEQLRSEAQRLIEEQRHEVEEAAQRAAERLEEAGRAAPNKPGLLKRVLSGAGDIAGDFLGGVVEGTAGIIEFGFKLTPTYALINPEGYLENVTGMAKGIAFGVTHPVEFAKAAVNWDMWLENPARALGQLVPELALSLATAGAGGAAVKGAGAARRAARFADDLSDAGRIARRAEDLADTGRVARKIEDFTDLRSLDEAEDFVRATKQANPDYRFPSRPARMDVLEPGEAWEPSQGTPVIGKLDDTAAAATSQGYVRIGETVKEWSPEKNDAWVQSIADQKGEVKVTTRLEGNLWDEDKVRPRVFAREAVQFLRLGYVWKG
ncbi:MAG TPA: hypothetical protein VJS45_00630, partial [Acidimicrobiia bacterium]|nr:hypothetical protein [Acidimicrobiia bacterium]